jgi:hypothetical protein
MNLYAYCKNSPLNFVDPTGLHKQGSFKLGSKQIVTGRYWVVPAKLRLSNPIPSVAGTTVMEKALASGIITIDQEGSKTVEQIDAQLQIYDTYLTIAGSLPQNPIPPGVNLTTGWYAYIEVQDWFDTNENDKIDGGDEFSEPYWLEITGFPSGGESDGTKPTQSEYDGDGEYDTMEAAADAAGTAISFAWQLGNPPGVLPSEAQVRGWANDPDVDPYDREDHHH